MVLRSVVLVTVLWAGCAFAQTTTQNSSEDQKQPSVPAVAGTQQAPSKASDSTSAPASATPSTKQLPDDPVPVVAQPVPDSQRQPKRILGVMPNYRAVSAGETPPPPTPKQAFKIATQNSFDYSSWIFVGFTSAFAEASNTHSQLGKGVSGFGRYYWRGMLDKTDGNYLVIWALPSVLHEDERYFAMGRKNGSISKRVVYSLTRIFITPNYDGRNTINAAELLGRGTAQAVSISYYPSADRTASALLSKYGYALLRDAYTNTFREFWPDIATHVLHRHP